MPESRMRVCKYLPEKLYGFCQDEDGFEVFFHLAVFKPGPDLAPVKCTRCPGVPHCDLGNTAPPPILGELVLVGYEGVLGQAKAPRATRVIRSEVPQMLLGVVESFDPIRRYGFVLGANQVTYHLHQSEIVEGRLPIMNPQVTFYPGVREGRPRACHVRVCR